MKRLFTTSISAILLFWSCNSGKLPHDGIEYITIFTNATGDQQITTIINDKVVIDEIITSINLGRNEPAKFRPDYKVEIKYKTDVKQVLVKGQYGKIDGRTFLMNEDLGTKLKSIVEKGG